MIAFRFEASDVEIAQRNRQIAYKVTPKSVHCQIDGPNDVSFVLYYVKYLLNL